MDERRIVLTDVDIRFGRMVAICFKWMMASIPAILALYLVTFLVIMIFGGMFAGCAALLGK